MLDEFNRYHVIKPLVILRNYLKDLLIVIKGIIVKSFKVYIFVL